MSKFSSREGGIHGVVVVVLVMCVTMELVGGLVELIESSTNKKGKFDVGEHKSMPSWRWSIEQHYWLNVEHQRDLI